jgi:hypothetical protein
MEREASQGTGGMPQPEADTSAGEYLADNDRTKQHGYNHLPHHPRRPDRRRQVEEAGQGQPSQAKQVADPDE